MQSSKYHDGRTSPVRKSIVYSPPRKDYKFTETKGQESQDLVVDATAVNNQALY